MNTIIQGDALSVLKGLPDGIVQTCVTSPPYLGLRDYGTPGQIGLEATPDEYVAKLVAVFREVKRVLRTDGTLWLNLGDSYSGSGKGGQSEEKRSENWQPTYANKGTVYPGIKPKDLIGIPWMVAFALRTDGWYLRSDIIWNKPNAMPESVEDRPTKSHEYLFLLSKNERYYYDAQAIAEPAQQKVGIPVATPQHKRAMLQSLATSTLGTNQGYAYKNKRSVWTINTRSYEEAHFATFPPKLIEPCILAGSQRGDIILDPFIGAGTTALVAIQHGRNYLGIDLNVSYVQLAEKRIATVQQNLWTSGSEAMAV